ncbi:MAG: hypothetical protein WB760_03230, partial [Xanthobacteraceae bacterium]
MNDNKNPNPKQRGDRYNPGNMSGKTVGTHTDESEANNQNRNGTDDRGRVNRDSAFSRAREGSGPHDLAQQSEPPMPRRATRARRIQANRLTTISVFANSVRG